MFFFLGYFLTACLHEYLHFPKNFIEMKIIGRATECICLSYDFFQIVNYLLDLNIEKILQYYGQVKVANLCGLKWGMKTKILNLNGSRANFKILKLSIWPSRYFLRIFFLFLKATKEFMFFYHFYFLYYTIHPSRDQLFKTRVAAVQCACVLVCTVEGYWLLRAELPVHPPLYIDAKEVVPPYAKGVERPTTPWRTTRPG